MDLVSLLIYFVVFGCVVWLAFWIIGQAIPEPAKMPAKAIVGIIALVVLLNWFVGSGGIHLAPLTR